MNESVHVKRPKIRSTFIDQTTTPLTETINSGLANATSKLTGFLGLKTVAVATAAAINELQTTIGDFVVVPHGTVVGTLASDRRK